MRFKKWGEKQKGNKDWKFAVTSQHGHFWEHALAWPVLQGLALFSSDTLTGSLQGAWTAGQSRVRPQAKPPEPRPCPYYSHSQSNCAQCQQLTHWIHRGQFAQPADSTLRRPVDLAAPAGSQIHTNTTSLSVLKHCGGSGLFGKSNTNKNTHVLLVHLTTTGISVRL